MGLREPTERVSQEAGLGNPGVVCESKQGWSDFPGSTVVGNLSANAGDTGSTPGPGRSHMRQSTKPMCHDY